MSLKSYIYNHIRMWRDNRYLSMRNRIMMDIDKEQNPQKKIDKLVILYIRGTLLGGMASSGAYATFKKEHFDTATTQYQTEIKGALMRILKSNEYTCEDKRRVAYVCADIVLSEAIPEIKLLIKKNNCDSIINNDLKESLHALTTGRSITELIIEELKRRGDI